MPLCYLFGPVESGALPEFLQEDRDRGFCHVFGRDSASSDVPVFAPADSPSDLSDPGQADFLAWWMPGGFLPHSIQRFAIPVCALAVGWREHWHLYRAILPDCAAVICDPNAAQAFRQAGMKHVYECASLPNTDAANLPDPKQGWQNVLSSIKCACAEIMGRPTGSDADESRRRLLIRALAFVDFGNDPRLASDLAAALVRNPHDAALHHALGIVTYAANPKAGLGGPAVSFQRAWDSDTRHWVAGLNLVEAFMTLNRRDEAKSIALQVLRSLSSPIPLLPDLQFAPRHPIGFESFRSAWERSGWCHAGDSASEDRAKRSLIRSRIHTMLASLTGDLVHFHEAAMALPDEPVPRAALGCALARAGRLDEALPHLQQAVAANPSDRPAARALFQLYGDLGQKTSQRILARERRELAHRSPESIPTESWFADAAPPGDELASILIVCWNGRALTQACIESVLANTRQPFELIVVDNGSSDGTAEYLARLRAAETPGQRLDVIQNSENRGYPAAMNQALAAAQGDYVVMLNNDTLVPPGWLDSLIAWLLVEWPQIGLVGPMTNSAPPPQYVPATYADPATGLTGFAQTHRQRYAGRYSDVSRLSGFCMLTRRGVLERVGRLDEQFGMGFFDDDDFVVRVRVAGFRAIIAHDVFVHHYGSQTFAALGVDCRRQLAENFARFRAKWGDEHAAGYRWPAPSIEPPSSLLGSNDSEETHAGSARVSLCIIAKNEEDNIAACLADWSTLFTEAIVADTGSTDRTREIARDLGAKVVDFPWCDSFAAARNASLEHATGDWIFWLDADDRLDEANRDRLRELFRQLGAENVGYSMKCVCLSDVPGGSPTVVDHMRLFRNQPSIRWKYRVHEQILPAIRASGGDIRWSDIAIHHVGYQDPALRRRKLERDLRLLTLENDEHPDDPFTLFNLGAVLLEIGEPAKAVPFLTRSIERSHPMDSIVRKLYALLAGAHRRLHQPEQALAACRDGRRHYPDDAELLFTEGLVHREAHRPADAEACWVRLLHAFKEKGHFASVDAGLRGFKTRHSLAILYLEQQRDAEAEAQWQLALDESPTFDPARLGLAELYLKQMRWSEFEEIVRSLESKTPNVSEVETASLRARGRLARHEYAAARASLNEAIERFPQDVALRVLLSHCWLQEGKDLLAAEQALLNVLEIDSGNREVQHNLRVLRSRLACE